MGTRAKFTGSEGEIYKAYQASGLDNCVDIVSSLSMEHRK